MTVFQGVSLTILAVVIITELWNLRGEVGSFRFGLLRLAIWVLAAMAIAYPDLTQLAARTAGIDRGADLVLYVFALSFLGAAFYFYSRYVRLQRQITEIVRHLALQNSRGMTPNDPSA